MLLLAKVLLTLPGQEDPKRALDAAITADGLTGSRKSARVKRIRALAELRMKGYKDAVSSAEETIAQARLGQKDKAREHFMQAKSLWPSLSPGQTAIASVTQGLAWIDSLEDMVILRGEAEELIGDRPAAASAP